jgi:hypothetical protein
MKINRFDGCIGANTPQSPRCWAKARRTQTKNQPNQIMKPTTKTKTQIQIGLNQIESIQIKINLLVDEFKDRQKGIVDYSKPHAIDHREFNRLCRRMKSSIELLNKECNEVFENPLNS